jgi:2-polyprenyl-3-methyl-5-hydroxy-6-metoxy-1,4-benzoquinol methylase
MTSDEAYFKHLCGGERAGSHLFNTTQLILDEIATHHYGKGRRWLDIGSGSGFLVLKLQQLGWDVFGLEPGGWGQIAAKEKGIKVIQSYLDQSTFTEKFFVISATDVLEHQPDPYKMLSLIRYHLESNGRVYISIPFADSFHGRVLKSHWAMVAPPTHCHFFSNISFHLMAERAGFKAKLGVPRLCRLFPVSKNIIDAFLKYTFGGDQALFEISPV